MPRGAGPARVLGGLKIRRSTALVLRGAPRSGAIPDSVPTCACLPGPDAQTARHSVIGSRALPAQAPSFAVGPVLINDCFAACNRDDKIRVGSVVVEDDRTPYRPTIVARRNWGTPSESVGRESTLITRSCARSAGSPVSAGGDPSARNPQPQRGDYQQICRIPDATAWPSANDQESDSQISRGSSSVNGWTRNPCRLVVCAAAIG